MRTTLVALGSCSVVPRDTGTSDPLETVPELVGARLAHPIAVTPAAGATCDGPPSARAKVVRSDVPVLSWTGAAGSWKVLDPPSSGVTEPGRAVLPTSLPLGARR